MPLAFRQIAVDTPDHAAMLALRERILRKPIGLSVTLEEIARDSGDYLLGGFEGDNIVCCLILQKCDGGWIKMRQVAVDNGRQGQGIGAQMLRAALDVLHGWGTANVYCHARETARDFYLQNGWVVTSDTFDENGIPHCRMEFTLDKAQ